MAKLIGSASVGPDALTEMRGRARPGTRWAAYQNHALDSMQVGHLQFLLVGPGCTFATPPARMPDTTAVIGWKYLHVGYVDLVTGEVTDGALEERLHSGVQDSGRIPEEGRAGDTGEASC